MPVDAAGFRERYPEFTDPPYTDEMVEEALEDAQCDFSRSKLSNSTCGENIYCRIIYALSAHELKIQNNSANGSTVGGGPIASKTVGKVSVSYSRASSESSTDDYYNQTIYGQKYLALLNKYCVGFFTVC